MTLLRTLPAALLPAALLAALPGVAPAQTSYLAPDGRNRYPGVTIFCPSGTGTAPCNFGSGGGGGGSGTVTINLGGTAVSASNRLPVTDTLLDSAVSGGAVTVAGTVGLSGTPTVSLGAGSVTVGGVTQSGGWTVGLAAGSNAIGSVAVSNLPATQAISGAVGQSGNWTVGLGAGNAAIGSVSVSNLPTTQPVSGSVTVSNLPATQPVSGTVSVSNLPATQPVSASALPLPAGAATSAAQTAPFASVAPGPATATNTVLMGCQANTSLPSFTAGQQGAIPCDTSGRPYVVSVPSANNVPGYLQAVASGGASVYRAINAASSAMAASVKGNTGMVYGYEACNSGAATAYLRLFATGSVPSVGTTVPQVVKLLPAGGCQSFSTDVGLVFAGGVGVDATSGSMADNDTTVIASAGQVSLEIYYK